MTKDEMLAEVRKSWPTYRIFHDTTNGKPCTHATLRMGQKTYGQSLYDAPGVDSELILLESALDQVRCGVLCERPPACPGP